MSETPDAELLAEFARNDCEEAFTVLVNRHLRLVYSVALRQTANPQQAEEVTQAVFIILARKARSLGSKTILSGWLYHAARLTAANLRRAELRRARRDHEALMPFTYEANPTETAWRELAPLLDDAMDRLSATDRGAVVLRYFENQSLHEVAQALGMEERAAQKRVSRALEKLRRILAKGGLTSSSAITAGAIAAYSAQAAPATLAETISATALKGSAVAGSTMALVKGTLHIMSWMKIKTAAAIAVGTVLVAGAGVAAVHHLHAHLQRSHAKAQAEKLQAERAGGLANVSADPTAQKLEDEQKAARRRPN